MSSKYHLDKIESIILSNSDRYKAHKEITPLVEDLCGNKEFLFDAIRENIKKSGRVCPERLAMPLLTSGDIMVFINLFCPIRDGGKNISLDNIHHHGWRLLTTGVCSGDGYEAIEFTKNSHNERDENSVALKVDEVYRHIKGPARFIDSHKAHVVFHPKETTATLAVWSADRRIPTQKLKRKLERFETLRAILVKTAIFFGLEKILGLNVLKGLYYHPEGGNIVETQDYKLEFDGDSAEILGCWFAFYQQIGFDDQAFWTEIKKSASPESIIYIDHLLNGDRVPDLGIRGNMRRRFSKTQILQALDSSVPGDSGW